MKLLDAFQSFRSVSLEATTYERFVSPAQDEEYPAGRLVWIFQTNSIYEKLLFCQRKKI